MEPAARNLKKLNQNPKLTEIILHSNLNHNITSNRTNMVQRATDLSDSSLDSNPDVDQIGKGIKDCFCANANYVQNNQRKLLDRELRCSFCQEMFVKPVTLSCGHTFCRFCALNFFLNNTLACEVCKSTDVFEHPFDLKINTILDSISRQLNPKQYLRKLKIQNEN